MSNQGFIELPKMADGMQHAQTAQY